LVDEPTDPCLLEHADAAASAKIPGETRRFPTESEKCVLVVDLEKSYPEAAPFSWKTIDFELTNLRTGMC